MNHELAWKELTRTKVWSGRVFDISTSRQKSNDGAEGDFHLLECSDWVNIVALTTVGGKPAVSMVRQYRFGGAMLCLEFPGGIIDPGENDEQAAKRELLEETGYTARHWTKLGAINPNPSFMCNQTHTWLALGLEHSGSLDLDELERLHPVLVPLADLDARTVPEFERNGIMLATWYWFAGWRERNPGWESGLR